MYLIMVFDRTTRLSPGSFDEPGEVGVTFFP